MKALRTLGVSCLALMALSPSAAAQSYPPTLMYDQLFDLPNYGDTQLFARAPNDFRILFPGEDALQVTFWLYKGLSEDPAARVMGAGDFRDGEAGWTGNAGGDCYPRKLAEPWWTLSHCVLTAVNIDLEPGDYTYVFYWRRKNGEPWTKMNAVHFAVKSAGAGEGRFAKAGFKWADAGYADAAALSWTKRGEGMQAQVWMMGPEPGNRSGKKCWSWAGLFKGDELKAVAQSRQESTCEKYWLTKKWSLQKPDRYGKGGDRFTSADLEDGSWTLVVANDTVRRTWKFEVTGGTPALTERQKDAFGPAWYQTVQYLDPDTGGGLWWLSPGIQQPISVK